MQQILGLQHFAQPLAASVVTIGNFDGVHRGHQALLERVRTEARQMQIASAVVTFDPHPVQVLYPDRELKKLFSLSDLAESLRTYGIDNLVIQPFSREFSEMTADAFLEKLLWPALAPRRLIIGYDFSFGAQRTGSADLLKTVAAAHGATVEVVPAVVVDGAPISSQRIRACLAKGLVEEAASLLGRPFEVEGIVLRGDGRGRQLGFPTANLSARSQMVPATGVYVTQFILKSEILNSVTNVGFAPTVAQGRREPLVETHLLNQERDLYGCAVRVRFLKKLRDEQRFSSVEDLKAAITRDKEAAQRFFGPL